MADLSIHSITFRCDDKIYCQLQKIADEKSWSISHVCRSLLSSVLSAPSEEVAE